MSNADFPNLLRFASLRPTSSSLPKHVYACSEPLPPDWRKRRSPSSPASSTATYVQGLVDHATENCKRLRPSAASRCIKFPAHLKFRRRARTRPTEKGGRDSRARRDSEGENQSRGESRPFRHRRVATDRDRARRSGDQRGSEFGQRSCKRKSVASKTRSTAAPKPPGPPSRSRM